jgi:hypothetical protein
LSFIHKFNAYRSITFSVTKQTLDYTSVRKIWDKCICKGLYAYRCRSIETTSLELWIFNLANKYKCMKIEQSLCLRWLYWDVFSRIPILWRHKKVVRQRTFQVTSRHSFITTVWYYASCIKNNQGYSLNQWAENKRRVVCKLSIYYRIQYDTVHSM